VAAFVLAMAAISAIASITAIPAVTAVTALAAVSSITAVATISAVAAPGPVLPVARPVFMTLVTRTARRSVSFLGSRTRLGFESAARSRSFAALFLLLLLVGSLVMGSLTMRSLLVRSLMMRAVVVRAVMTPALGSVAFPFAPPVALAFLATPWALALRV